MTISANNHNDPPDDDLQSLSPSPTPLQQTIGIVCWMLMMLAYAIYCGVMLGVAVNVFRKISGI